MSENIITVKNIKTGEVLEFTGQNAVAKYLTGVYGKKIYAGAIALKSYLEVDDNVTVLENALWSNVEGAELISTRRNKKKC